MVLPSWRPRRRRGCRPSREERTKIANIGQQYTHKEHPGQGRHSVKTLFATWYVLRCVFGVCPGDHRGGGGAAVIRAWEKPKEQHNPNHIHHNRHPSKTRKKNHHKNSPKINSVGMTGFCTRPAQALRPGIDNPCKRASARDFGRVTSAVHGTQQAQIGAIARPRAPSAPRTRVLGEGCRVPRALHPRTRI